MARLFAVAITLSEADRAPWVGWTRHPKTAQALALLARINMVPAEPGTTSTVSTPRQGITTVTGVAKWRGRFAHCGRNRLHDEPRSGATRMITDPHVGQVIATTPETIPADATHRSTRRLDVRLGPSQSAISRMWHTFCLEPHRAEAYELSTYSLFIDRVHRIVGL